MKTELFECKEVETSIMYNGKKQVESFVFFLKKDTKFKDYDTNNVVEILEKNGFIDPLEHGTAVAPESAKSKLLSNLWSWYNVNYRHSDGGFRKIIATEVNKTLLEAYLGNGIYSGSFSKGISERDGDVEVMIKNGIAYVFGSLQEVIKCKKTLNFKHSIVYAIDSAGGFRCDLMISAE